MLLEVKELTKQYRRGNADFAAIDSVNLSVSKHDFISIIGRSGSGKSTLLNLIAGLLKPSSGSIYIEEQNVVSFSEEEASFYRNAKIGYIPQGQSILSNLTVLDNVMLPFYFFNRKGDAAEKASSLLAQVGIAHLAKSYPNQLSGGELRRVSIARALINEPVLLIADEPTSDLDVSTTAEIMALFQEIAQNGTAILMVTHEMDTINYGNRTFVMESGKLTESIAQNGDMI